MIVAATPGQVNVSVNLAGMGRDVHDLVNHSHMVKDVRKYATVKIRLFVIPLMELVYALQVGPIYTSTEKLMPLLEKLPNFEFLEPLKKVT